MGVTQLIFRSVLLGFAIASLPFASGCGPGADARQSISGSVTLHGQPLESGRIQFEAVDGSHVGGAKIIAGKYTIPAIKGLFPGKFLVRVSAIKEGAYTKNDVPPGEDGAIDLTSLNQELIPAQYNNESTVTVEITAGSVNTYDLVIP